MLSRKKVGDSVWSFHLGDCRVVKVHGDDCEVTKLSVSPDGSEDETMLYLSNGKQYEGDHMPTCYPERPEWVPPPVKMIHGHPVPDIALRRLPDTPVVMADPTHPDLITSYTRVRETFPENARRLEHSLRHGMVYPATNAGTEAARTHAMALLGLKPI